MNQASCWAFIHFRRDRGLFRFRLKQKEYYHKELDVVVDQACRLLGWNNDQLRLRAPLASGLAASPRLPAAGAPTAAATGVPLPPGPAPSTPNQGEDKDLALEPGPLATSVSPGISEVRSVGSGENLERPHHPFYKALHKFRVLWQVYNGLLPGDLQDAVCRRRARGHNLPH